MASRQAALIWESLSKTLPGLITAGGTVVGQARQSRAMKNFLADLEEGKMIPSLASRRAEGPLAEAGEIPFEEEPTVETMVRKPFTASEARLEASKRGLLTGAKAKETEAILKGLLGDEDLQQQLGLLKTKFGYDLALQATKTSDLSKRLDKENEIWAEQELERSKNEMSKIGKRGTWDIKLQELKNKGQLAKSKTGSLTGDPRYVSAKQMYKNGLDTIAAVIRGMKGGDDGEPWISAAQGERLFSFAITDMTDASEIIREKAGLGTKGEKHRMAMVWAQSKLRPGGDATEEEMVKASNILKAMELKGLIPGGTLGF